MIDAETKQKLLKELQKSGNVGLSCMKVGVDRSTFYRWGEKNKKFKVDADKAITIGRENNNDVAEHALMIKVKEKDMTAIKYQLSHNSARYKPKPSTVNINHKTFKKLLEIPKSAEEDMGEFFAEDES